MSSRGRTLTFLRRCAPPQAAATRTKLSRPRGSATCGASGRWRQPALAGAPARAWHEPVAFAGVALELKAATRPSVSRNQKAADAFLADLRTEGWFAMRVLGADRAIATLRKLGFTGPAFDGRLVR